MPEPTPDLSPLPCPFCGCDMIARESDSGRAWCVCQRPGCAACGPYAPLGPGSDPADAMRPAIAAWNRRRSPGSAPATDRGPAGHTPGDWVFWPGDGVSPPSVGIGAGSVPECPGFDGMTICCLVEPQQYQGEDGPEPRAIPEWFGTIEGNGHLLAAAPDLLAALRPFVAMDDSGEEIAGGCWNAAIAMARAALAKARP